MPQSSLRDFDCNSLTRILTLTTTEDSFTFECFITYRFGMMRSFS